MGDNNEEEELRTKWQSIQKHAALLYEYADDDELHFSLLQDIQIFVGFLRNPWFAPDGTNLDSSGSIISNCYLNTKKKKRVAGAKMVLDKENCVNHSVDPDDESIRNATVESAIITAYPSLRIL